MRLMVGVLLFSAIWLKPIIDPAGLNLELRRLSSMQTQQWTTFGKKPIMWRTAAQLRKYEEEEYTSLDDSISVTPDTDDTSCETTSQYEVMDDVLPASVRRGNKAMFHMEPLRYELNRWF